MSGYPHHDTSYQPAQHHHQHPHGPYHHQQEGLQVQPQTPLMHPSAPTEKHMHASHNGEWENGFCSCCSPFGTCCLGTWCPCILYGRTNYRLEHNGSTDGYSCCNSNCCFYACLTIASPLQTFLGYFQRKKIRQQFGLSGGCCGDCLRHFCCSCCALIQEEKEVIQRTKQAGYQASAGMSYPK